MKFYIKCQSVFVLDFFKLIIFFLNESLTEFSSVFLPLTAKKNSHTPLATVDLWEYIPEDSNWFAPNEFPNPLGSFQSQQKNLKNFHKLW